MKAVIFAAGKSTRTYPLTVTRPKPLLPIANQTILEHQLEALRSIVDTVVLVVGYKHEMIRERFGGAYHGLQLEYVVQEEQRGTGHALLQCDGRIREPFMALNGDDLYDPVDLARLAEVERGALCKSVEDPRLFGVFVVDRNDRVERVVEKPKQFISNLANIGAYKFTPNVFSVLREVRPSERGEIEITSAIQVLADTTEFRVVEVQCHWLAITYPWTLLDANAYWLENKMEPRIEGEVSSKATLNGDVAVGKGSVIRPGAVIDGPVLIGENATVGPNCWIRPGTTIGNGCKAGMSVEIKNSIIMDGTAVPHLSYVGDSVIGEKANLGCGTVTANFRHDGANHRSMVKGELVDTGRRKLGAILGDGVHTGINTSIYPGRKIWPGLSTLPGEVVDRDRES